MIANLLHNIFIQRIFIDKKTHGVLAVSCFFFLRLFFLPKNKNNLQQEIYWWNISRYLWMWKKEKSPDKIFYRKKKCLTFLKNIYFRTQFIFQFECCMILSLSFCDAITANMQNSYPNYPKICIFFTAFDFFIFFVLFFILNSF